MSTPNAEPTMETNLEPTGENAQLTGPPAPLPPSFKCEKCGAALADEGAAAAHTQTCKGPEGNLEEPPQLAVSHLIELATDGPMFLYGRYG